MLKFNLKTWLENYHTHQFSCWEECHDCFMLIFILHRPLQISFLIIFLGQMDGFLKRSLLHAALESSSDMIWSTYIIIILRYDIQGGAQPQGGQMLSGQHNNTNNLFFSTPNCCTLIALSREISINQWANELGNYEQ